MSNLKIVNIGLIERKITQFLFFVVTNSQNETTDFQDNAKRLELLEVSSTKTLRLLSLGAQFCTRKNSLLLYGTRRKLVWEFFQGVL